MPDLEALAAVAAGGAMATAILAVQASRPRLPRPPNRIHRMWRAELDLRRSAVPAGDVRTLLLAEPAAWALAAGAAWVITGLPVVAAASAVTVASGLRMALRMRAARNLGRRQDAVLEAVRMLRGLLESGGVGVQQALAVLADRGPVVLRSEFAAIVAAGAAGRQTAAWRAARARVQDPLFDMLCAAILVQRPAGGPLAPLFADLEESVAGIHEVTREAAALQLQARSAAALVVTLPLAFLFILSALRSPYLDAYHTAGGSAFLAAMLAVIGSSYVWIQRWLRLPAEPRLDIAGA